MNYNLSGKGIFVFSDPAGANTVFAIVDQLLKEGKIPNEDFLVFTNPIGVYSHTYDTMVSRIDFSIDFVRVVINKFEPDYLFSATSLNDFEHQWRKFAQGNKLKSIGFIDHWTNYTERFSFNGEVVFADEIWVINEIAKKEAINAGIPENLIVVSGNPYYEKVSQFKPEISKRSFFDIYNLNPDKKTILFISDDIRDSFPKDEEGICILGFDEYTVLQEILESFAELDEQIHFEKYQFVIKLHPRSKAQKFDKLLKTYHSKNLETFVLEKCEPLTINYYSDYVLGMFSNMVIEAWLMRKKMLRVQIGQRREDFIKFKLDSMLITSSIDLKGSIIKLLNL